MEINFGDLPVNLRQEILNLLRDRNIIGSTLTITELQLAPSSNRPHRAHPPEDYACGMPGPRFDMGGTTDPTSD